MKRILQFVSLVFLMFGCKLKSSREYTIQRVNFTIEIPKKFDVLDSNELAKIYNKIEDSMNAKASKKFRLGDSKPLVSIINAENKQFNNLTVTAVPYKGSDEIIRISKEDSIKAQNSVMEFFKSKLPDSKVDNFWTKEVIAGRTFDVQRAIITSSKGDVLNSTSYSILYKGYTVVINISYTDSTLGKELKHILSTSKFN